MSSDALFHSISVIMFMRFILSLRSLYFTSPEDGGPSDWATSSIALRPFQGMTSSRVIGNLAE